MKKILMTVAAMAAMVGFAGQDDLLVTISANEKLCYNDANNTLVNNEVVALVWTPANGTFGGFLANGSIQGDSKVLARMVVTEGMFPTTTFQISKKFADENKLSTGSFVLYLLDTRGADGVSIGTKSEAGFKEGVIPVNYYAKIMSADIASSTDSGAGSTIGSMTSEGAEKVIAQGQATLPLTETELQPIIKSVKVEDGKFKVTIENAVPYLKYGLATGETPNGLTAPQANTMVTPKTETVTLEQPMDGDKGFIKVNAARNQ